MPPHLWSSLSSLRVHLEQVAGRHTLVSSVYPGRTSGSLLHMRNLDSEIEELGTVDQGREDGPKREGSHTASWTWHDLWTLVSSPST